MNRLLFELQEADNNLLRLAREKAKLDDGTAARRERDSLQGQVDAVNKKLHDLNASRTDRELQLKSTEEKIKKQGDRLMHASNAHEITSLQRDIEGLSHARGDHDEAILTLMDEAETASGELTRLEEQLREQTRQTIEVERVFVAETARLDGELAEAKGKRRGIAEQLDPASLEKYSSFAKKYQGVAVVHPEHGNCSGCGMTLTPFNLREAKGQEWPTCENCGRLLFLE